MKAQINNRKLALVCTQGGHFEQLMNLEEFYNHYEHFWITNKNSQTISGLEKEKKYFMSMAHYKKPWTYVKHIPIITKIFIKEKPTHIISTGSGRTALIPFLLAKIFGIAFIYIDTFSRVNGYSKFGHFLLKLGHPVLTQWEHRDSKKAIYIGAVFKRGTDNSNKNNGKRIFVTLGTREEGFPRLINAVEGMKRKNIIKEEVIVQAGKTKYASACLEIFDFCAPKKIEELISEAKYVITQESAGIGTLCLKLNKKFIVMPRDYQYGELPSKSDMQEDLHWKLQEMGYTKVVNNGVELENAIKEIDNLKYGFHFDNQLAIRKLTRIVEES